MRINLIRAVAAMLAALLLPTLMFAQRGQQPPSPTQNQPFDPHDFSGIWIVRGATGFTLSNDIPPMTPWAKAKYDANKPGIGPRQQPLGNDPIMICDPIGYPRILFYGAYPVEIVQLPGRMIQFFDFFYTHRTIWTDGRKLPEDPEPAWYGYAVGRWEGDTFIVDSYGFDKRSWLDADGHPHSDEMRLEERYRRVDHDTIEETMTPTDPMAYTKPWVSKTLSFKWSPKEVMREDLCAPSDESKYKDEVRTPAGTK